MKEKLERNEERGGKREGETGEGKEVRKSASVKGE